MEKTKLKGKILKMRAEMEQLNKELAKAKKDLSKARNEGFDKGVDTVYKIL